MWEVQHTLRTFKKVCYIVLCAFISILLWTFQQSLCIYQSTVFKYSFRWFVLNLSVWFDASSIMMDVKYRSMPLQYFRGKFHTMQSNINLLIPQLFASRPHMKNRVLIRVLSAGDLSDRLLRWLHGNNCGWVKEQNNQPNFNERKWDRIKEEKSSPLNHDA